VCASRNRNFQLDRIAYQGKFGCKNVWIFFQRRGLLILDHIKKHVQPNHLHHHFQKSP
jgi:hypothetical protein